MAPVFANEIEPFTRTLPIPQPRGVSKAQVGSEEFGDALEQATSESSPSDRSQL